MRALHSPHDNGSLENAGAVCMRQDEDETTSDEWDA
jgi:hypothetical protein